MDLSGNKISLAIPTYNRYDFVLECIEGVMGDPRIGDITIHDDRSTDGSYQRLKERFPNPGQDGVWLHQAERNRDCYWNKMCAVQKAAFDWVILFDDDNVLTTAYLDALYGLPEWDETTAYCPEWAEPHFDYRRYAGKAFDRHNVASAMDCGVFRTMLNTANYFVNRLQYLRVFDGSVDPHTADSIYQNYNWLNRGNRLHVVQGLRYFHRVHDGSHYKREHKKTGGFAKEVEAKLKALR